MTLREDLNKIVNSNYEADKGLLIITYLESMRFSLRGNGWLDDDQEAYDNSGTRENRDLVKKILSE